MSQEEAPFIYIAGPLFDPGERWYLEQIDAICRDLGLRTYLPHRDGGIKAGAATDFAAIFAADLAALERADLVVAVWNGPDVDSGTVSICTRNCTTNLRQHCTTFAARRAIEESVTLQQHCTTNLHQRCTTFDSVIRCRNQ